MKKQHVIVLVVVTVLIAGIALIYKKHLASKTHISPGEQIMDSKIIVTASGLKYEVLTPADANAKKPVKGQTAHVHYTGWLTKPNSEEPDLTKKFDSSVDRQKVFKFPVGHGRVIRGWDEGVLSMSVGEKRRFTIPANLAYGPGGIPGVIPQNATLVFDVELLDLA